MTHGQFCAVARAHEAIGGRWTILVVRELLCGSRRFNDIRRGIPRISRTMLSERLHALVHVGAVEQTEGAGGPEYALTVAGEELAAVVGALGTWGQRWLKRHAVEEDLDAGPVLVDMARRVRPAALPKDPLVVRLEIDRAPAQFLLLTRAGSEPCGQNPGFPEPLTLHTPLPALVAWWRGDVSFPAARRMGLALTGSRALARAFPDWFERYLFAGIAPARAA